MYCSLLSDSSSGVASLSPGEFFTQDSISCFGAVKLARKPRVNKLPSDLIDTLVALTGKGESLPHSRTRVIISCCLTGSWLSLEFDDAKNKPVKTNETTRNIALDNTISNVSNLVLFFIVVCLRFLDPCFCNFWERERDRVWMTIPSPTSRRRGLCKA